MNTRNDKCIALTLDAGGANYRFSAIRGNPVIAGPVAMPSEGDHLDKCLENIANALTLSDGLAVIGGGIAAAWPLFLPAIIDELNDFYTDFNRKRRESCRENQKIGVR
jgi:hypothetical protein